MAKQKAESEMQLARAKSAASRGYYGILEQLRQLRLKSKAVEADQT